MRTRFLVLLSAPWGPETFPFSARPGLPAMELERLPFGSKYSPYLCLTALARVLQGVLPPRVLLVHYLDDCLLVYTNREVF